VKTPLIQADARIATRGPFDLGGAKTVYESVCTGCHSLRIVEKSPPESEAEARDVVARMVENGLDADRGKLEQVVLYLAETYGK
jgi:cytochrome c5